MSIVEQLVATGEHPLSVGHAAFVALEARVAALEGRIGELEAHLQQNSTNSSIPPSLISAGSKNRVGA